MQFELARGKNVRVEVDVPKEYHSLPGRDQGDIPGFFISLCLADGKSKLLQFHDSLRDAGRKTVRTEDIGNKLTGNIGNTLEGANALEKRVTHGTKTAIYQFGADGSLHGERAVPGIWDYAQDRAQVAGAVRGFRPGGLGGTQPCAAQRDGADGGGNGTADCEREAAALDLGTKEDSEGLDGEAWRGATSGGEHGWGGAEAARDGEGATAARGRL